MGVKIREKRGKLYLDIYVNGARRWEALGVSISKDKVQNKEAWDFAEICRSKREIQIAEGKWGIIDHLGGKIPLYTYIEKMGEVRNKQKDRVCKVLPWLAKYPGGNVIQLGQVNSRWFINFQDFLLKESGLSEQSANSYAFAVRMALSQAVRENILSQNPAEGIKGISIPETDKPYLTMDELQKLAKVSIGGKLGAEVKRAFLFACYCALRVSDVKTLTWADIEHTAGGAQIVKRQIKTRRRVVVPLHESAWKLINDGSIHNRAALVFPLLGGSKTDTNKYLIQWTEQAGIDKHITWHAARRTCPSLLHELGVDVYTIQKICGHSKIETTAIYMKQAKIFWIVFLAALVIISCGDSSAQPADDGDDGDDDIILSIGADAVTQAVGDFTVWRHPPVANHPTVDFGVVITGYSGSTGALTIPATLDGSPVIGIGDGAFGNNTSVTSILIPAGVKGIGDYVFQNCTALTSVTLPAGIKKIKNGAFSGCTALAAIAIPGTVTKIEHYAFNGCGNLVSVTLPVTKVKIENTAFVACPALDAASQTAIWAMGYTGTF